MLCFFPQDFRNGNDIFEDNMSSDMTKEEFRNVFNLFIYKMEELLDKNQLTQNWKKIA